MFSIATNKPPLLVTIILFACTCIGACTEGADEGESDMAEGTGESSGTGDDSGGSTATGNQTEGQTDNATGTVDTDTPPSDAEFEINVSLSEVIPTVAIVTWSVDKSGLEEAFIEFGRDGDFAFTAPVDLAEPDFRTLLLGMKASTAYEFRIVATAGDERYESAVQSLETGPVANGLSQLDMTVHDAAKVSPGFILTSFTVAGWTFIMDADGEYVWFYETNLQMVSRAAMSYDGKTMWIRDVSVGGGGPGGGPGGGAGEIRKVSMDGLSEERFELPNSHHDLTTIPDGSVAYIEQDGANCDRVMELGPDGGTTEIYALSDAVTPANDTADGCHANSISYQADGDTYTVSVLNRNAYVRFTRGGELVWVFGADTESTFTGDTTWDRQHGHHSLDDGRFLVFNNRGMQDTALAVEYQLDTSTMTATQTWEYDGGVGSTILGDVQGLPNGNVLVTYSESGVMHEVDADTNLVREMTWALGGAVGYALARETLYGPPPKG